MDLPTEIDTAALAVLLGAALIAATALLSAPSRPMAARTDWAALTLVAGAISLLWGVRAFKRRRDERRRRRDDTTDP